MEQCDLAIVGGSFAGLSCAREAAHNGLTTQVFERKIAPGAYTQSTGLFVQEIADQMALPERLIRRITGVRLYAPNLNYVDLRSPGYEFIATDTPKVLSWMAEQAQQAGAIISASEQVQNVVQYADRVVLPEQDTAARYLVAADGANSTVARALGLGTNKVMLSGAEYEVDGFHDLPDDLLHVFISNEYAPGYIGWLFKGVHSAQLGIAVKPGHRVRLRAFFELLKRRFDPNAKMLSGRGGYIPCGGVVHPWARDNVCLLGDAAGMVSPLTAGGIHPSIEVGQQLGAAIAMHLRHDLPLPQEQIRALVKTYPVKRQLRRLANLVSFSDRISNHVINNTAFQRAAQLIFFHNRGLFSKRAWGEILFAKSH